MSVHDDLTQAKHVLTSEAHCILAAKERLGQEFTQAIQLIVDAISHGGKVVVTGVGKSGKIAAKIAATLASMGTPALYLHPTEGIHGDLGLVSPKDTLLALSYSGSSEEILRIMPRIKSLGTQVISIVGNVNSPLSKQSDVTLDGSVAQEACPLNLAPTSSTTVALALGDALAVCLSVRFGFKEENFIDNHPGGALGRRLSLQISDLMKKAEELPWVSATASMEVVVSILTEKKLGAVLVYDQNRSFLGLITDGDIRRALKYGEKFFSLKAQDIMTRNPVSIHSKEKAIRALQLMENRASQINVLPVLEQPGHCVGLVRLHDLIGML